MNKFKEFWKSYIEVCKISNKWVVDHWIGYTILIVCTVAIEFTIIFWDEITDWFRSKFCKKRKVELEDEEWEEFEKDLMHEFNLD